MKEEIVSELQEGGDISGQTGGSPPVTDELITDEDQSVRSGEQGSDVLQDISGPQPSTEIGSEVQGTPEVGSEIQQNLSQQSPGIEGTSLEVTSSQPQDGETLPTSQPDLGTTSTEVSAVLSQTDQTGLVVSPSGEIVDETQSQTIEPSQKSQDLDEDVRSSATDLVTEPSVRTEVSPTLSQSPLQTGFSNVTTEPSTQLSKITQSPSTAFGGESIIGEDQSSLIKALGIEISSHTSDNQLSIAETVTNQTISPVTTDFESAVREDLPTQKTSVPLQSGSFENLSQLPSPAIKVEIEQSVVSDTFAQNISIRSSPELSPQDLDEDRTGQSHLSETLSVASPLFSPPVITSIPESSPSSEDDIRSPKLAPADSSNLSITDSTATSIGKIIEPPITPGDQTDGIVSYASGYLRDSQRSQLSDQDKRSPWMKIAEENQIKHPSGGPVMIGDSNKSLDEESAVLREYQDLESASGVSRLTIGGPSTRSGLNDSFKTKILQPSPELGQIPTFEPQSAPISTHIDSNVTGKHIEIESTPFGPMPIISHQTEQKESEIMHSELSLELYPSTITKPVVLSELTSPLFGSDVTSEASNMLEMSHHIDANVNTFETHHLTHQVIKTTCANVSMDESAKVKLHSDGTVTATKEGEDGKEEDVVVFAGAGKTVIYGGVLALLMISL